MAHFAVKDLSFSYPHTDREALIHVNLEIEQGQYICLCGRSGSGKTTLMKNLIARFQDDVTVLSASSKNASFVVRPVTAFTYTVQP